MIRRFLPSLALIAVALLALGVGLARLQRIFSAEAEMAHRSISERREALAQYAAESLRTSLEQRLRAEQPRLRAAEADPLVSDEGLWSISRGEQQLPRLQRFDPGLDGRAQQRYQALRAHTERSDDPSDPWTERLALFAELERALDRDDETKGDRLLTRLLLHRATYRVASLKDLPLQIVLLERLYERTEPLPDLMAGLIRDGLEDAHGGRIPGLQRQLLLERQRFGPNDFAFLAERVARLSDRGGLRHADFDERVRALSPAPLPLPVAPTAPTLLTAGLLSPVSGGGLEGFVTTPSALLEDVTAEMRHRGLLSGAETLALAGEGPWPLSSLAVDVRSPRWTSEAAAVAFNYRLKSGLLLGSALLGLGLIGAALLAQARKRRFLELKSDFLSAVSHELRTPLAAIRVMGETLEQRLAGNAEAKDYPQRIVREADGLSFLVENLLSFHRIDKGRWVPQRQPVRVSELAEGLRAELAGYCDRPVELHCEGDRVLDADAPLLRLLFSNLGRNACAYNLRTPVRLELAVDSTGRIRFSDNGVGIPPEQWHAAFEEFHRLEQRDLSVHGSGLGLSLCRKIAALHGGTLEIATSSPEGTTFLLTLPESAR